MTLLTLLKPTTGGGGMAASVVGVARTPSDGTDATGASLALTIPSGTAIDDYAVIIVELWDSTATNPTLTYPSGFSQIVNYVSTTDGFEKLKVAIKPLTAADSGTYSVSGFASHFRQGHVAILRGIDLTTALDVAVNLAQNASGTALPANSITTVTDGCLLMHVIANENTCTGLPATGYTEQADSNYTKTNTKIQTTAGTDTPSGGSFSASTLKLGALIAFRPAASGTDATATPSAVASIVATPQATPSAGSTKTPTVTAAIAAAPQAIASVSDTATPAVTAGTVTVPQVTVVTSGNATATPGAIAAPAALPAASRSAGSTVAPAQIITTTALPPATPQTAGNATSTPATVAAATAIPQPSPSGSAVASPVVTVTTVALPQASPSVGGSATVSPSPISAVVTLPVSQLSAGSMVVPARIQAAASLPAATRSVSDTASPGVISSVVAFLQGLLHTGASPSTTSVVASLPPAEPSRIDVDTPEEVTVTVRVYTSTAVPRSHLSTAIARSDE